MMEYGFCSNSGDEKEKERERSTVYMQPKTFGMICF